MKGTIKSALAKKFRGGYFGRGQISEAIDRVFREECTEIGWIWSVGISGSPIHTCGWAESEDGAQEAADRAYKAIRSANPVLGSLACRTDRETSAQRFARLLRGIELRLNT